MENKQLIDLARDQLNRVLGFFPRVDAKISVLLSVAIAMLALLAGKAPIQQLHWNSRPALAASLALVLIALSLLLLYQVLVSAARRRTALPAVFPGNRPAKRNHFHR